MGCQSSSEKNVRQPVNQVKAGFNGKDFASAVKDRRTIYSINKEIKASDNKIKEIVEYAVKWGPSSFNSQSSRVIVLYGAQHDKFWEATREILRNKVPADKFGPTNDKMTGFKNGYATVMFFEDQETVKKMENQFPSYAHNFQPWSLQSSGMAQYITWAGLETEGFGCSLQHYTPLVDETVQKEWGAPTTWKLLAQMVVGNPTAPAGDKAFMPIQDRVKVFSSQTTSEQTAKQVVTQAPGKGMNFKDFASAVKDRRTIYSLNKEVKVSDARIREVVEYAVNWAPSAFNSQSSRVIVLFGSHHDKFWDTTREILRKIVPAETFAPTDAKMTGFKNGYATVMFFEDQEAIKKLEDQFPSYAANFQPWSLQSSGMAQFVTWVGLEAEGLGCSLQHYSPLVDETVQKEWGAPTTWKLLAQMVVGNPTAPPGEKTFLPIEDRVKHYK